MQKPPLSKYGDYSKLQAKWNDMEEHGDATKMAELLRVCIVLPEGQSLIPSNWEDHSLLRPPTPGDLASTDTDVQTHININKIFFQEEGRKDRKEGGRKGPVL